MVKDRLNEALSPVSTDSTVRTPSKRKRDARIQHYYSSPEIISKMDRLQVEWGIENRSALTRWLLAKALEMVEKGKIKPKMETVTKARLD